MKSGVFDINAAISLNDFLNSLQGIAPLTEQQKLPQCPEIITNFFLSLTKNYTCTKAKVNIHILYT